MSHVLRGFPYPGTTRQQSGRQGHWKSLWDRVSIDHLLQDLPPDLPTCWGVPCLSRKVTASQKIIWEITISLPSGNLFYFLEVRCLLLCYWEKEDLAMFSLLYKDFSPLPSQVGAIHPATPALTVCLSLNASLTCAGPLYLDCATLPHRKRKVRGNGMKTKRNWKEMRKKVEIPPWHWEVQV